jgi:hypothetical protein
VRHMRSQHTICWPFCVLTARYEARRPNCIMTPSHRTKITTVRCATGRFAITSSYFFEDDDDDDDNTMTLTPASSVHILQPYQQQLTQFHILQSVPYNSIIAIQTNKCIQFHSSYNSIIKNEALHVSGHNWPIVRQCTVVYRCTNRAQLYQPCTATYSCTNRAQLCTAVPTLHSCVQLYQPCPAVYSCTNLAQLCTAVIYSTNARSLKFLLFRLHTGMGKYLV